MKLIMKLILQPEEEQKVLRRYNTISAAVMAEINHFHRERNTDFNVIIRNFLQTQLQFHKNVCTYLLPRVKYIKIKGIFK